MDFMEGFPWVGGKSVILTIVDRFSKMAHFVALSHPYSTYHFWEELFKLAGVKLLRSSAFHPETDSQSKWLLWAEFCFNTSYQSALQATPFEVVYGQAPPALMSYTPSDSCGHHSRFPSKLGPRYFGAYQVVERLGAVAYRLKLPPKARIHDVFHVALLKKYEGDPPAAIMSLPAILRGRVVPTPSQVVWAHLNCGCWELLVQWDGCSATDATWEPLADFKERYPLFQLTDELFDGEEGNVVDSFVGQQYWRWARRATANSSG
ncbi:uncharacterized protein [Miscanthus floridulus]|uniref:uncharacterized protein n=1 Tax=Miscanthus floridulus TaxID=154761 RepID=UPI0034595B43